MYVATSPNCIYSIYIFCTNLSTYQVILSLKELDKLEFIRFAFSFHNIFIQLQLAKIFSYLSHNHIYHLIVTALLTQITVSFFSIPKIILHYLTNTMFIFTISILVNFRRIKAGFLNGSRHLMCLESFASGVGYFYLYTFTIQAILPTPPDSSQSPSQAHGYSP